MIFSRRSVLGTALAGLGLIAHRPVAAGSRPIDSELDPASWRRALDALARHSDSILSVDYVGVVDFSLPSRTPRFHLVNPSAGTATSHLVAHGRGSDPAHTGWLQRFSNEPGSHASSSGAYVTRATYAGSHGRSLRLDGLDPSNSNAASREIVVHQAPYVSDEIIARSGVLGRSEGCFAVSGSALREILDKLGPGRLIYADKA